MIEADLVIQTQGEYIVYRCLMKRRFSYGTLREPAESYKSLWIAHVRGNRSERMFSKVQWCCLPDHLSLV